MKRRIVGIFVCMILTLTVFSLSVSSYEPLENTIYVDDDAPSEWYDETHVHTIQEGIDSAHAGGTVLIYEGVYHPSSNIFVHKELHLTGESKEKVIVEKEIGSEELSIRAKNIVISDITFINFAVSNECYNDNLLITNNDFIINNHEGHWNPSLMDISGNNNEISNNIITFAELDHWKHNPSMGISFQCYQSKIVNNIIVGKGRDFTALDIYDRTFWPHDILLGENKIYGNVFMNNGCGISVIPTLNSNHRSEITHNNFIENKIHARFCILFPSVIDIIRKITEDIENTQYVFSVAKSSYNYWDSNYWDSYGGFGPKKLDGTIQTPGIINQLFAYVFPWIIFDWHPVKEPYDISMI